MEKVTVTLKGIGNILMHSDRLCNPLDDLTKEIKKITSKRKKTDSDYEEVARLEWKGGMYFDDKIGPFLPGRMLKAVLVGAAKKSKEGPKIRSGLIVQTDKARLEYDGPRDQTRMWKSGSFADMRSVGVNRSRVMRCRPVFRDWSANFEIVFDPTILDKSDVVRLLETAGSLVGIGDYRPECGGDYGRFEVAEVKA